MSCMVLFTSCEKKAERIITKGTWMVSLYSESGKDETSDFTGFVFEFKSNGTLAATKPNGEIVIGSWSYDDAATKYIISISATDKLDKLNDNWIIVSKSSELIELQDDNAAKNELLNFKKR